MNSAQLPATGRLPLARPWRPLLFAFLLACCGHGCVEAQTPTPPEAAEAPADGSPDTDGKKAAEIERLRGIVRGFHPQQGTVALPSGMATLNVPPAFCYLNSGDSHKMLVDIWRNPPSAVENVTGMLLKTADGKPVIGDWGVVITYENEGYVKDTDADKINYTDLLKKMQTSMQANNAKRQAAGYPAMELVGWAAPPRYDKQAKKMYWAKELKIGDSATHTLNYDIRILGRRGVLSLNAVAGIDQLPEIEQATPAILSMVNFNQGHRYADFDPKTDRVAEYGLAALVAGGLLLKAGGFKALLVALLAFKKFIVIGVAAVATQFKKFFGGGVKTHETPSLPPRQGPTV